MKLQKIVRTFLITVLLLCMTQLVHAADTQQITIEWTPNPAYEGIITEDALPLPSPSYDVQALDPGTWDGKYMDAETATDYLREQMVARNGEIFLPVYGPYASTESERNGFFNALMNEALAHTGNGDEGDYLHWHYAGYGINGSLYTYGEYTFYEVTVVCRYYTTAQQEATVTSAVNDLILDLDLASKSDYEKVVAIYDYICDTVTYDDAAAESGNDPLAYTAYGALIEKSSVCQGYANLFYRLALDVGVDCRFIGGIGNGGNHGWNIVKLGDKYYNLDSTWDSNNSTHYYFLKSQASFYGHARFDVYATDEFNEAYPMSAENYADHKLTNYAGTAPTCTAAGLSGGIKCTACGAFTELPQTVPALGHDEITIAGTAPTCTETGLTDGAKCDRCGVITTPQQTVPAAGHSFAGWTVTQRPTATQKGEEQRQCTVCNHIETRSVGPLQSPFSDVKQGDFYFEPVLWAVENGITNGVGGGKFGSEVTCTRSQVVTFLWRAADCPEPASAVNNFTDVAPGSYYEKAVLWAVEQGITHGVGGGKFGPEVTCTRSQVATFLWRANGQAAVSNTVNTFTDVPDGAFYSTSVLWAVENGITNGIGGGKFGPDITCTRSQIVTFLYRAYH